MRAPGAGWDAHEIQENFMEDATILIADKGPVRTITLNLSLIHISGHDFKACPERSRRMPK